jgi:molybdenum cofactor biosynthesis enzyme MoaA
MGQVTGQFVVKTFIKTTVCENCKRLRVSVQGKPHICVGLKGRRVSVGKMIVLGKHKTTVSVTSAAE